MLQFVWCTKYNYVKMTFNSCNASFGPCDHTQMALDSEYELKMSFTSCWVDLNVLTKVKDDLLTGFSILIMLLNVFATNGYYVHTSGGNRRRR